MKVGRIVRGQRVSRSKVVAARQLRKSMTPAEARLWSVLRGNALLGLHFRRQQIIAGFIVDFYCHGSALVIEVDGGVHLDNEPSDIERDGILADLGFEVLRFTNEDIEGRLGSVLESIERACLKRKS
jgi:very-short-patch-repair endonuclease